MAAHLRRFFKLKREELGESLRALAFVYLLLAFDDRAVAKSAAS